MLNIYTLAGKKFLKLTTEYCMDEFYVALDQIIEFFGKTREGETYLSVYTDKGDIYNTSYLFSDLEDSVKAIKIKAKDSE